MAENNDEVPIQDLWQDKITKAEPRQPLGTMDADMRVVFTMFRSRKPDQSDHIDLECDALGLKFRFYRVAMPESPQRLYAIPAYTDLQGMREFCEMAARFGWEALYKASIQQADIKENFTAQNEKIVKLSEFMTATYGETGTDPVDLAIKILTQACKAKPQRSRKK